MSEKYLISKTKDIGLALMRTLPRVSLKNLRHNPNSKKLDKRGRAQHGGDKHGCGQKTSRSRMLISRIGFEGGNFPFYRRPPNEPYYERHHLRRQYPPITLQQLQTMIDTNRLDVRQPIDLVALMRTGLLDLRPAEKHFGFQLKDDGANIFKAKINIEVQAATELVIATIERCGGRITTAYYDMQSLQAMVAPQKFYERGVAIPRRMVPPANAIPDYCDAKKRGYLADPAEIERERQILAQKYGYILPETIDETDRELMSIQKSPVQIFYGLEPGWVINLRKHAIYKPLDGQEVTDYFKNDSNFQ